MKTLVGIGAVAVVAIGVGFLLTHQGQNQAAGPGGPGGPGGRGGPGGGRGGRGGFNAVTVGVSPVGIGNIPIQIDALGAVTPPITATVASRIAGNLMAVYFKEGQMVKKGDKLALIDPRPYKVALEQAQGALQHDQALLDDARLDLKRYQTLAAQNSIAQQQVDTQAALVKQDEGQIKTDQANVDSAKLNLTYTLITAPAAGRVGLRQVDVGNYIPVGSTTGLVVLTQVDPIDVVFTIPEDNVPAITQRQRTGSTLPVTVFDRAGGTTLGNGYLLTLDNQIDPTTGTVKAKARFDNGNGALFPQQFVNARLLVNVLCNVVVVPTTAVRHGSAGDFVYTLQPNRTAKQVAVKTGPGTAETVSIASGLKGGETVITEGGDRLRDGAQVNLPGQRPAGGFSGGRRGRGGFGARAGAQGGGFGGAPGAPGAGGVSGGFAGRRGGQGAGAGPQGPPVQDVAAQMQNSDGEGLSNQGLPAAQVPPGFCSSPGSAPGAGKHFGQGGPGGAGPGGFPRRGFGGQGPQGQAPPAGQGPAQGDGPGAGQTPGGPGRFRHGPPGQGGPPGANGQGQAG